MMLMLVLMPTCGYSERRPAKSAAAFLPASKRGSQGGGNTGHDDDYDGHDDDCHDDDGYDDNGYDSHNQYPQYHPFVNPYNMIKSR